MKLRMRHKKNFFFLAILFLLVCALSGWQFLRSNQVKKQADNLIKYGEAPEAIALYKEAQRLFPLRWDIAADIAGAELILKSNQDYDQITDFSEFQEAPPLTNLPPTVLKSNQLFVPILMYHHIRVNPRPGDPIWAALNVTPNQLEEQFAYLTTHNYHPVTLDDLTTALDGKTVLPNNPIILTFDDGYRNFYENAFPLLKKYQVKATEFIITQVLNIPAYLTWNQIGEMDKSGLVYFGAHTRHHPNLPDLSQTTIIDEIKGSKADLEQHLKKPINWFAYPYGSYSNFIIQTVQAAGFTGAASTIYGPIQSKDTLYLAPRIMVDGRFSLDNIVKRIQP